MGCSFGVVFFYCEYGEYVIMQFEIFDEEILHLNWYKFPVEMQQWLVTFMVATQSTPMICGFGNSACIRESFKKVRIEIMHSRVQ